MVRGPSRGHSAEVRIELHVNGTCIPVAKTGGDRLVFREPVTLSASDGEVVMHIDGHERRWRVTLQPGAQPNRIVPAQFAAE